jgi:hypothetical protein
MFEERAILVIVPFIIGRIAENINYGTVSPNSTFQKQNFTQDPATFFAFHFAITCTAFASRVTPFSRVLRRNLTQHRFFSVNNQDSVRSLFICVTRSALLPKTNTNFNHT